LPINHLLGENCGTQGRIGEVGLEQIAVKSSGGTQGAGVAGRSRFFSVHHHGGMAAGTDLKARAQ
jgi:hypothetical protein